MFLSHRGCLYLALSLSLAHFRAPLFAHLHFSRQFVSSPDISIEFCFSTLFRRRIDDGDIHCLCMPVRSLRFSIPIRKCVTRNIDEKETAKFSIVLFWLSVSSYLCAIRANSTHFTLKWTFIHKNRHRRRRFCPLNRTCSMAALTSTKET